MQMNLKLVICCCCRGFLFPPSPSAPRLPARYSGKVPIVETSPQLVCNALHKHKDLSLLLSSRCSFRTSEKFITW